MSQQFSVLLILWLALFMNLLKVTCTMKEFTLASSSSTTMYTNNSTIDINLIGEGYEDPKIQIIGGGALLCHINDDTCCRGLDAEEGAGIGEWYFPNGSAVPAPGGGSEYYRTRGPMVIRLNRVGSLRITGKYRCWIPGNTGVINRYITLTDSSAPIPPPTTEPDITTTEPDITTNEPPTTITEPATTQTTQPLITATTRTTTTGVTEQINTTSRVTVPIIDTEVPSSGSAEDTVAPTVTAVTVAFLALVAVVTIIILVVWIKQRKRQKSVTEKLIPPTRENYQMPAIGPPTQTAALTSTESEECDKDTHMCSITNNNCIGELDNKNIYDCLSSMPESEKCDDTNTHMYSIKNNNYIDTENIYDRLSSMPTAPLTNLEQLSYPPPYEGDESLY